MTKKEKLFDRILLQNCACYVDIMGSDIFIPGVAIELFIINASGELGMTKEAVFSKLQDLDKKGYFDNGVLKSNVVKQIIQRCSLNKNEILKSQLVRLSNENIYLRNEIIKLSDPVENEKTSK